MEFITPEPPRTAQASHLSKNPRLQLPPPVGTPRPAEHHQQSRWSAQRHQPVPPQLAATISPPSTHGLERFFASSP